MELFVDLFGNDGCRRTCAGKSGVCDVAEVAEAGSREDCTEVWDGLGRWNCDTCAP